MKKNIRSALLGLVLTHATLYANEYRLGDGYFLNVRGHVGFEYWAFPEADVDDISTLFGNLDLRLHPREKWEIRLHPRLVVDFENSDRSRVRPPLFDDLYFNYYSSKFEVRAGYQIFSWKTVESNSPADFLNQKDWEEDLLDPEKLSELAVRARLVAYMDNEHIFEFYLIPYHRPAMLPRVDNPYYFFPSSFMITNDRNEHQYAYDMGAWMPQGAARYSSTYLDFLDLSLFYFFGYDRFPGLFEKSSDVTGNTVVAHEYRPIMKTGLTFQGVLGSWLLKGEVVANNHLEEVTQMPPPISETDNPSNRTFEIDPFVAYTVGFEYTLYSLLVQNHDVGLILEFLGDSDFNTPVGDLGSFRPFRSHVFGGLRYAWNNVSDRSVLIGGMYNYWEAIENGETEFLYQAEFSERLFKHLVVKIRFSDLVITNTRSQLYSFRDNMRLDAEALISF